MNMQHSYVYAIEDFLLLGHKVEDTGSSETSLLVCDTKSQNTAV